MGEVAGHQSKKGRHGQLCAFKVAATADKFCRPKVRDFVCFLAARTLRGLAGTGKYETGRTRHWADRVKKKRYLLGREALQGD